MEGFKYGCTPGCKTCSALGSSTSKYGCSLNGT